MVEKAAPDNYDQLVGSSVIASKEQLEGARWPFGTAVTMALGLWYVEMLVMEHSIESSDSSNSYSRWQHKQGQLKHERNKTIVASKNRRTWEVLELLYQSKQ